MLLARSVSLALILLILSCVGAPTRRGPSYLGVLYTEGKYGAEIIQVMPNSPAELCGLRVGDTILSINGHRADRDLKKEIVRKTPGEPITIMIRRYTGEKEEITVKVDSVPAELSSR